MRLFWFEIYKTFSRWRTYISFGAIALLVLLIEGVIKLKPEEVLHRATRSLQSDFLISGDILNGWFVTALIMNSLHVHIPFLITLVAGDIVSGEATSGTVRLLLIRPPSRARIIVAKYLTALFYSAAVVLFLGFVCTLLGLSLFGSGDLMAFRQGRFGMVIIPENEIYGRMALAFSAAVWSMTVVASLAFLFSTLAENSIGPIIGTMAVVVIFFVLGNFPFDFLQDLRPFLFTTYMNFWHRFLDDPISWEEITRSAVILGLHNVGLFSMAFILYQRKDIKS